MTVNSLALAADTSTQKLKTLLESIHTLQANFQQQVITGGKRQLIQRSSGRMVLARPGCFLWETLQPGAQMVVTNGQRLWVYDKDLEQVTVRHLEKADRQQPGFLLSSNVAPILQDYNVTLFLAGNSTRFLLKAKKAQALFQQLTLRFENARLDGLELLDGLGQRTVIQLTQVRLNPAVSKKLFEFTPPKGVDVVY